MNFGHRFESSSLKHFFGTDRFGRDVFSRVIVGTRFSLSIAFLSTAITLIVGIPAGIVAGYFEWAQTPIMRLVDIMLSFPGIMTALIIIAVLGPGLWKVIIAISFSMIPQFARVTNSLALSIKEEGYIEAAHALGAGDLRIITVGILPHCIGPLLIQATLFIPDAIIVAASLSFLGLGVQPPTAEWGLILKEARGYLREAPYISLYTALMMGATILSFNLLGDTLRERLDPRLKHVGR